MSRRTKHCLSIRVWKSVYKRVEIFLSPMHFKNLEGNLQMESPKRTSVLGLLKFFYAVSQGIHISNPTGISQMFHNKSLFKLTNLSTLNMNTILYLTHSETNFH